MLGTGSGQEGPPRDAGHRLRAGEAPTPQGGDESGRLQGRPRATPWKGDGSRPALDVWLNKFPHFKVETFHVRIGVSTSLERLGAQPCWVSGPLGHCPGQADPRCEASSCFLLTVNGLHQRPQGFPLIWSWNRGTLPRKMPGPPVWAERAQEGPRWGQGTKGTEWRGSPSPEPPRHQDFQQSGRKQFRHHTRERAGGWRLWRPEGWLQEVV